ncbi:zona pellucida glycoprotein d isoform X1 [Oncorhynchus kisutch]|uniref:uromodulin-like isoform X1 n=2 Tax=Oncorhynchus kisutch TaxID=8019 RepID=UPI0009A02359|nr:uromodulin-like isoform X1 [Oncorhynchus kisutch]XP_031657853.1 uromodulin-like isoform X1 [Oncorhynchus kisutch]XP_031657855.1 uromodulin isoform X1 [Oncorhynchus kisutch]
MALKFNLKVNCCGIYQVFLVLVIFCCDRVLGICTVTHCTDTTKCLLSLDKSNCKCAVGYYGDLCDKVATINVMCGKDYITIMVNEDFFQYYKVPMESLHLKNESCRAQKEVMSDVPYYIVRISKDQYVSCGGKPLEKNITHIAYALTLMSAPQVYGNIIRDPMIKIEYTCIYPYIRTVSLPYPIIPFSSETVMRMGELDAKVEMALFTDHTYTEAFQSSPLIHLRDRVYVEIKVVELEDVFHLRVNECWATQSPKPNQTDSSVHTLLRNGCVNDETVTFLNTTMGANGEASTIRYSFDMFRFVVEPHDLYLHCAVRLCSLDDDEPCIPECKSITKRAAVRGDPTQGLLSYGPIRIDIPDRPQSNLLLLLIPVAGIWVLGLFLLALITIAKAGNRRLSQLANR